MFSKHLTFYKLQYINQSNKWSNKLGLSWAKLSQRWGKVETNLVTNWHRAWIECLEKNFWVWKFSGVNKFLGPTEFVVQKKIFGREEFLSLKTCLVQKQFWSEKVFESKKCLGPKNFFGAKHFLSAINFQVEDMI